MAQSTKAPFLKPPHLGPVFGGGLHTSLLFAMATVPQREAVTRQLTGPRKFAAAPLPPGARLHRGDYHRRTTPWIHHDPATQFAHTGSIDWVAANQRLNAFRPYLFAFVVVVLVIGAAVAGWAVRRELIKSGVVGGPSCTCPAGTVCAAHAASTANGANCVQCASDNDCGTTERCVDGSCLKRCTTDAQCVVNRCGPDGTDCSRVGGFCKGGGCVECQSNAECARNPSDTVCFQHKCVQCVNDTQCGAGQSCDVSTMQCVDGCGAGGTCAPGTVCDVPRQMCVACLTDSDCSSGTNRTCDSKTHTCVECATDAACTSLLGPGATCNPVNHKCQTNNCASLELDSNTSASFQLRLVAPPTSATSNVPTLDGRNLCLTTTSQGSCPPNARGLGHPDEPCAVMAPCDANNTAQFWIAETVPTGAAAPAPQHMWFLRNTSVDQATSSGNQDFATTYMDVSNVAEPGDAVGVLKAMPTVSTTSSTLAVQAGANGMNIAVMLHTQGTLWNMTVAEDTDPETGTYLVTWNANQPTTEPTDSDGNATTYSGNASLFAAHFLNPAFTACSSWFPATFEADAVAT